MLDIYLIQMTIVPNDKAKNFAKVLELTKSIRKTAEDPVRGLIVLPEMFATGYLPLHPESAAENFSSSESGETAYFLNKLANETGCAVMGAGIASLGKNLFNHSSVFLPDSPNEYAHYDKRRPFFMEQEKFSRGESVNLFKLYGWNTASTICFDLRFPELYRDAVKAGAKLITVQAAWPKARIMHWKTLLQARAIENQVYIAAVNCTSLDGTYNGCSMIIDPKGEIIAQAKSESNEIVFARIESIPQENYRKQFPVLRDLI